MNFIIIVQLEQDFNTKYPQTAHAFGRRWPIVRTKLTEIFQGLKKPVKDSTFIKLACQLPKLVGSSFDAAVLLLLSNTFPKSQPIAPKRLDVGVKRKRGDNKISIDKSQKIAK